MYDQTANQANAIYGTADAKSRPLDNIALAVNRINTATVLLGQFVDRFHGAQPEPPTHPHPGEAAAAGRVPYATEMERLFSALDRLETCVEAVTSIG